LIDWTGVVKDGVYNGLLKLSIRKASACGAKKLRNYF